MSENDKLDLILSKLTGVETEMTDMKTEITGVKLHLENVTDRNLSILAENHLSLVDKLNTAVKVSDKTLLYEIQVNTLSERVQNLEKEVRELKNKIA